MAQRRNNPPPTGEPQGERRARGREAEKPTEIPRRGWRDVVKRTSGEVKQDNVSIVAAGVAFYSFVSIFPALAAVVSLWGLVADPGEVDRQLAPFARLIPGDVQQLLHEQLSRLAAQSSGALGIGALVSIAVALWSGGKGLGALITALNIAYDQEENR